MGKTIKHICDYCNEGITSKKGTYTVITSGNNRVVWHNDCLVSYIRSRCYLSLPPTIHYNNPDINERYVSQFLPRELHLKQLIRTLSQGEKPVTIKEIMNIIKVYGKRGYERAIKKGNPFWLYRRHSGDNEVSENKGGVVVKNSGGTVGAE